MKKIFGFLSLAFVIATVACNNETEKKSESNVTNEKAVEVKTVEPKAEKEVVIEVPLPPPPPPPPVKIKIKRPPLPPLPPPPPPPPLPKKNG